MSMSNATTATSTTKMTSLKAMMMIASTMTATAAAMAAASATVMAGPQTTINLSYRNGGSCSWATAGQQLRNVNGKGVDGSDGDGRVRSEEAMPSHPLTPAKRRGGAMMTTMHRALRLLEEERHQ